MSEGTAHFNASTGDISFPMWIKVVGGIMSVCTPLGIMGMAWLVVAVIRIDERLTYATEDRYRASEHELYAEGQSERDQRQNERIAELERIAGRGPNARDNGDTYDYQR